MATKVKVVRLSCLLIGYMTCFYVYTLTRQSSIGSSTSSETETMVTAVPLPAPPHALQSSQIEQIQLNYNSSVGKNSTICVPSLTRPSFSLCVYDAALDKKVSGSIHAGHPWEPEISLLINRTVNRYRKSGGITFINIGAHLGLHSFYAALLGALVIAVEPHNSSQLLFKQTFQKNRELFRIGNIALLPYAVSDSRRQATMIISPTDRGRTKLLQDNYPINNRPHLFHIQTLLLDDLIGLIKTRAVLLLVNAESHDCHVIAGGHSLIQSVFMPVVIMEWGRHGLANKPCVKDMANYFRSLSYSPYKFSDQNSSQLVQFDEHQEFMRKGNIIWMLKDAL